MELVDKAINFLPSLPAKVTMFIATFIAVLLYSLLLWMQDDLNLSIELATKLAILVVPLTVLLVGAIVALCFMVGSHKKLLEQLETKALDDYLKSGPNRG